MRTSKQSGRAMLGVMIAAAIGLVLVLVLATGGKLPGGGSLTGSTPAPREDGKGTTIVGRVAYEAKDEACKSNLDQTRQAIQIATDPVESTPPASLAETKLSSDFLRCPIGKEAYIYDPASGQVSCPHPGHGSY